MMSLLLVMFLDQAGEGDTQHVPVPLGFFIIHPDRADRESLVSDLQPYVELAVAASDLIDVDELLHLGAAPRVVFVKASPGEARRRRHNIRILLLQGISHHAAERAVGIIFSYF